jgi:hypothetical protein
MMLGFVYSTNAQESWPDPDPELLSRARALLAQVPLIDGHNDLPSTLLEAPPTRAISRSAAAARRDGRGAVLVRRIAQELRRDRRPSLIELR